MRSIVLHHDANRLLLSFALRYGIELLVLIRSCRGTSPCRAYAAVKVRGRLALRGPSPQSRTLRTADLLMVGLPRKEVIQPHLPVRLPCYDFTPLTLHTFDASAPEGFGRRLRVQTTRVV